MSIEAPMNSELVTVGEAVDDRQRAIRVVDGDVGRDRDCRRRCGQEPAVVDLAVGLSRLP